ncbi:MAG: extracellular solute-binding protein [Bdellovibrionales bacterium]
MKNPLYGVIFGVVMFVALPAAAASPQHGLALHGQPKYPADFKNLDYVNPDAPKGGQLRLFGVGTYDTLNPYTLKGVQADGAGLLFETLMTPTLDEPSSEYGLIAESVTVADDRSWVSYKLRPEARFNDGSKITPEDVIFSFEILREKGHPLYRSYYADVAKAEKLNANEVKFTFRITTNNELPYIMGQLPVLSKKFWQGKDFAATTLTPILGSGPYKIANMDTGRSITYERVKDWWGKDLPINRGRYNFDTINYDYYRDTTIALEGLLAGRYDYKLENVAKNWALNYNTPAVQQGHIKKEMIRNQLPQGMQAFIINIRRPIFQDPRVRQALNYAFDFEWSNKTVAYGAYKRLASYFENSELAGHGLPTPAEMKLLEPWRGKIPDEVFTTEYKNPTTDGSGDNRENLRKAAELLKAAGWELKNGKLTNADGKTFTFEIIENDPMFDRWIQPYLRNLERLGIYAQYRVVDSSQMQNRLNDFNFDVTVTTYPQSLSPGNEERDYFGSKMADTKGSRNLIGIKDPAVDALIESIVHAQSREDLVAATRALDRVLMWNHYVVPHWYIDSFRIAYWDMFGQPAVKPPYGLTVIDGWWTDAGKSKKIMSMQKRNR